MNKLAHIILILSLLIVASCQAPLKKIRGRTPSSIQTDTDIETLTNAMFYNGAEKILRYFPKLIKKEKLLSDKKILFKLMQEVEIQNPNFYKLVSSKKVIIKKSKIPSSIFGEGAMASYLSPTLNQKKMDYQTWNDNIENVLVSYSNDKNIFKIINSDRVEVFSLWGVKLTEKNVRSDIIENIQRWDLNKFKVLNKLFNHQKSMIIEDDSGSKQLLRLPYLTPIPIAKLEESREKFYKALDVELPNDQNWVEWGHALMNNQNTYLSDDGIKHLFKDSKNYLATHKAHKTLLKKQDSKKYCSIKIYLKGFSYQENISLIFIKTLERHKLKLMRHLSLTNSEYNELAALAAGILAVESSMGSNARYTIKEKLKIGELNLGQWAISLMKSFKGRDDVNSRGLTQIKTLGERIESGPYQYLLTSDLNIPENAALATIFVLEEKLRHLKYFKKYHQNIDHWNWHRYLYYMYQGNSKQITKGLATPDLNINIRKIKEIRDRLYIFENCGYNRNRIKDVR